MIAGMLIGEKGQKTNIIFLKIDNFENYINAIDVNYISEDVVFTEWLLELNTAEFDEVKRSQYVRGRDFKQEVRC